MLILLSILATYRLSYLLVYEDGPLNAFAQLRETAKAIPVLGDALQCIYCLSMWTALPITALSHLDGPASWAIALVDVFASSAGAIVLFEFVEAIKAIGQPTVTESQDTEPEQDP